MNYPWNYYNFYPYGYNHIYKQDIKKNDIKVAPLNINLTVDGKNDCKIYQPKRIINMNEGVVVVPEINLSIKYNYSSKNKINKPKNNKRKNNFKNSNKKPKPNFKNNLNNNLKPAFMNSLPPNTKVIELDSKDLMGKNPLEALFGKLLGIDKKENMVAEAPLKKELNFDLEKEYEELPFKVNSLDDLINLADLYDGNNHMFGFNMKRLNSIKDAMIRLNGIIGMKNVKQKIADKLITYLQGLGDMDDMNHIVIQAPPGYGKTMLGFHLSEIFYKLGLIKVIDKKEKEDYVNPFNGEKIDFPFVIAKRKDLIGEYVGHTAPKVEKMVERALGGVLFIDEAYSIGSSSRESFSDEAINTLNQLLSEKAGQFICIIAGYKDQLKKSFFTNPGLERRFRIVFEIEKYSDEELGMIFNKMVTEKEWHLEDKLINDDFSELIKFMNKNKKMFKFCGGDMETLFQNVRDAHSKRVFGDHPKTKKIITIEDLNNGYKLFEESVDREDDYFHERFIHSMYM